MATSFPSVEQLNKARTEASQFSGGPTYSLTFTVDGKQYSYIPSNIAENGGMTAGENTYLLPYFTSLDNLKDFGSKAQEVDLSTTGVNKYLQSQGLSEKGYLIPFASVPFDSVVNPIPTEVFGGELNGLKVIDGQVAYGLSGGHGRRYATTTGEVHDPYIKQNDSFLAGLGSVIQNMGPLAGFIGNLIAPGLGTGISMGTAIAQGASPEDLAKSYISAQLGNQVGASVGSETGSPIAGNIAGNTASGVLAGQPLDKALVNAAGSSATSSLNNAVNAPSQSGGLPTSSTTDESDYTPSTDYSVSPNYGLTPSSPASTSGLNPNLNAPLSVPVDDYTVKPDYSLSTSTPYVGLQPSATPNINNMNGGQGITIPVEGGTATSIGVTPDNASPNLGDPNSIINNPNVLGTAVAPTDTTSNLPTPRVNLSSDGSGANAAGTAARTTASPYTSIDQVLDSSPQYLGYTLGNQSAENEAQNPYELKQLYDSLDPALAEQLRLRGIAPQATASNAVDPQLTSTKLVANGGTIKSYAAGSTVTSDLYDSSVFNPKITKANPNMLPPAPVVQMPSRLGALKHIFSGIGSRQPHLASGGLPSKYTEAAPKGHNPEFVTGLTGYYAQGKGTGQSDDIPAMLHDGDYVADADLVAALGDGSSKAGAEALEKFRRQIPHQESAEGGAVVPAKIADGEYVFPASFVTAIGRGDNKAGAKLLDAMRQEIRAHKRSAPTSKIPPKAKSPLDYLKMVKG